VSLPAIAQGILGVEYRADRGDLAETLAAFEDSATATAARAERALGRVVEGSCEVPVGGLATVRAGTVTLEGFIGLPDGSRLVRLAADGESTDAEAVGERLGEKLLGAGGREILDLLERRA
jgi:hydroxymethylbilane synthase